MTATLTPTSAIPAIAACGTAPRDIFLSTECDAAIATVAGFHQNFRFICKHGSLDQREISQKAYAKVGSKNKNTRPGELERVSKFTVSVGSGCSRLLLGGSHNSFHWKHADILPKLALVFKADHAVNQRKQAVILRAPNIFPGLVPRAALPDQDASARHHLSAEPLHSKPLSLRVASICG